jgi:hypothetical protein
MISDGVAWGRARERMSMKNKLSPGRLAAVRACAASLAGTATAIAPAAASARAGSKCPDKSFALKPPAGGKTVNATAKAISVQGGVGCAEAYKVIRGSLEGKVVNGWAIRPGGANAPKGFIAEMAEKPGKTIKFAVPAG